MNIKNLAKRALYSSGFYRFQYAIKTSRNKRLLILMYHDLVGNDAGFDYDPAQYGKLTKDEFEAHLIAIKASCRTLSVEKAIAEIKQNGDLKENSVALTFDDGYASAYEIAFPILKKHGFSATIYLPTDWINGNLYLWWQDLTDMILGFETTEKNIADLKKIGMELSLEVPINLTTDKKVRMIFREKLSNELMKLGDERRNKIMDDLRSALFGDADYMRREIKPLTWDQVAEMAGAGIMFGAHTCSHLNLSYADLELARKEIVCSKKEIERRLGREIKGFAYPYGHDVSGYEKIVPLLDELGFDYACTTRCGNNNNKSHLFLLNRNTIPPLKSLSLIKRELYSDLSE